MTIEIILSVLIFIAIGMAFDISIEVFINNCTQLKWSADEGVRLLMVIVWPFAVLSILLYLMAITANWIIQTGVNKLSKQKKEEIPAYENSESGKAEVR